VPSTESPVSRRSHLVSRSECVLTTQPNIRDASDEIRGTGRDRWLLAILALSAVLNAWHLTWGLPNGNSSWAADAIGPVTALGIARRTLGTWNSGWFYFKYPPGWPFVMVVAGAPYLGWLYATGAWRAPSANYPYGFADPERTLFVLAMLARMVNVAFGVVTVALAYGIANRLLGRGAARWSAFLIATAYPIVYYAHTSNLDIGYCCWLILALYCAIVAAGTDRPLPWIGIGVAAGMALATKEQGFAFLLPLPIMALAARARRTGSLRAVWQAPARWMIGAGVLTLLLGNNALVNPLGFIGRIAYLLGHPLEYVDARLAPVEFALWKGPKEWVYARQLWDGLESSLGLPLLAIAGLGAVTIWRRPRAALWLVVPTVVMYYLSLRGLDLITLRYLLPVTVVALILAGAWLAGLWARAARTPARWVAGAAMAGLAALSLARAVEVNWLLSTDARYHAEAWMAAHLPAGARAEVYQKPAFIPRFRGGIEGYFVPFEQRSRAALLERAPDAIVTSSASRKSITHSWTADWRKTHSLLTAQPAAVDLLAGLEAGQLPYRVGAVFRQDPVLLRNRITSLAPEITIYVRDQ
jgi:4-amino-4-deoxy-L-arabinose transferase-like glycosyltransferase